MRCYREPFLRCYSPPLCGAETRSFQFQNLKNLQRNNWSHFDDIINLTLYWDCSFQDSVTKSCSDRCDAPVGKSEQSLDRSDSKLRTKDLFETWEIAELKRQEMMELPRTRTYLDNDEYHADVSQFDSQNISYQVWKFQGKKRNQFSKGFSLHLFVRLGVCRRIVCRFLFFKSTNFSSCAFVPACFCRQSRLEFVEISLCDWLDRR